MSLDIASLLAQAQAIVEESHNIKTKKVASIKPRRMPKISSNAQYSYDPATYATEHKHPGFILLKEYDEVKNLVEHLETLDIYSIDTETKYLSEYPTAVDVPEHIVRKYVKKNPNDVPFGLCFSDGDRAWFVVDHFDLFKDVLKDKTKEKILHNAKYDLHMLANIGLSIGGKLHDTLVLLKLFNENLPSFRLKDLAVRFVDKDANKYEVMKDNWMYDNKTSDWTAVPEELMADYGASDAFYTYKLWEKFYPYMEKEDLLELYERENELTLIAFNMERVGFKVDREYLENLKPQLEAEIAAGKQELYDLNGGIFNTNSAPQLEQFFLKLGVPQSDIHYTEKGNPCFDKDNKKRLAKKYDIVNKLVEVGKLEKLLSSYVLNILGTLPANNRSHCSINTIEAKTGRMSITDPALQTLPKKDKRIRSAFIPDDDYVLFFFDYDQVEYRLFAHYSQEPGLIDAIQKEWDVHRATAALVFNKQYDEVNDDERSKAKTINFALIYGVGIDHLAEMLDVDVDEAKLIRARYFASLPNARKFINTVQTVLGDRGWVRNFYGRRRRLKKDEVFKGPNSLIQGCAADVLKVQAVKANRYLVENNYKTRLLIWVHDETAIEVHKSEIEFIVPKLLELLSDKTSFRVPITAGCEWSPKSWGTKADYDITKSYEENLELWKQQYEK